MVKHSAHSPSCRALFARIGMAAGSAVMYEAMTRLGYTAESDYTGPIKLGHNPRGTSVVVLGAGLAGMTAALELRNAGYKVQVLEFQDRAGGRNWSIRGGDTIRELGGFTQHCQFDKGLYLNPGPWRIPYHHHAIFDYCRRLNVALEPFQMLNYNALVHNSQAFGGKPRRYREVQSDFTGHVAELLAKCATQSKLDQEVTREDRESLLEALRDWGALDSNYEYRKGIQTSERRGYRVDLGGGLSPTAVPSDPMALGDVLQSRVWSAISPSFEYDYQATLFQPVGGMGMIGEAFGRELGPLIKYNSKVTEIKQDGAGVTVTYVDSKGSGPPQSVTAQWCINAIPCSILSQVPMTIGAPLRKAINSLSYAAGFKAGLQFKRRFWEEDEAIYGGITYTDLPISIIGYPSTQYMSRGKGVLLGAYTFGPYGFEFNSLSPEDRMKKIVEQGAMIHPQYRDEFENGVSVGWYRIPWTHGCYAEWTEENRRKNYKALCAIDGRMVLAGEHAAQGIWQEHAILSALDAVKRVHQRVMAA